MTDYTDLSPTDELRTFARGRIGHLELNRPKALNSLDDEMCLGIENALKAWADDPDIDAVVITSTSPKAFCAGGDVRRIRELQLAGDYETADKFFADEYRMNALLGEFPKPYVAVIDGYVMGGGMGISIHGSHRVVTEKVFGAMPEMAIGFSTDVGVSYAAQRVKQAYGPRAGQSSPAIALFMGLTGFHFKTPDLLWSGIATHFVHSDDTAAFVAAIDSKGLDAALEEFARPIEEAGESFIAEHSEEIEEIFGEGDWFEIERKLDSGEFDQELVAVIDNQLASANPASLVATTEIFRANEKAADLREGLRNEYEVGKILRRQGNFAEGVRAVLVDKDRNSSFDPHVTNEVDPKPFREALS